jgi:O-acetyl-ADP-ribose deacetylase (regulator of RNase III)
MNVALRRVEGDITKIRADVVVNAANTELVHGGGVARAIARAGGEALERESREAGFVPLGGFAATTAGELDAERVVHIPTIDYTAGGARISYEDLEAAWRGALAWCHGEGRRSIATPLLGAASTSPWSSADDPADRRRRGDEERGAGGAGYSVCSR